MYNIAVKGTQNSFHRKKVENDHPGETDDMLESS